MSNNTQKAFPMILVLSIALISWVAVPFIANKASARGEAEVNDSSGGESGSSGKSKSSSSKSKDSSKKSDDASGAGSFSTATDNRRGADKPEDNGVDATDNRRGADKPEDNGVDAFGDDNRNGAQKPEDNSGTSVAENEARNQGEDSLIHRSAVAEVVQSLLTVADREGGIGSQIRNVAKQQNESKDRARAEMDKIKKRGKLKIFFFGADEKAQEKLRAEIELTRRNEAELRNAAQQIENEDDRVLVAEQADVLKVEIERMKNVADDQDQAFSLFGWTKNIF